MEREYKRILCERRGAGGEVLWITLNNEKTTAEMMSKPPLALRAAKNVVNNWLTCESIEAALAIERGSIMWLISSEDSKEGIAAFVEKRTGDFKGR